jgi:hypothetical protein
MDFNCLHGRSEHVEEGVLVAGIVPVFFASNYPQAEKGLSNLEEPVGGSGYNAESDGACQQA